MRLFMMVILLIVSALAEQISEEDSALAEKISQEASALNSNLCPCSMTKWLDRDNPSGTGDWETVGQAIRLGGCPKPCGLKCETVSGVDYLQTGELVHFDVLKGCWCINSEQKDGECQDYRITQVCCKDCPCRLTQWINRDLPSATGDWEMVDLAADIGGCKQPCDLICQTKAGIDYSLTGEIVHFDVSKGCWCVNQEQKDKSCSDYRIKQLCCEDKNNCVCKMTNWINRDAPSGTGDWETVPYAVPLGGCKKPCGLKCQTVEGVDYSQTGQDVNFDILKGCWCINADQKDGRKCLDYRITQLCCQ